MWSYRKITRSEFEKKKDFVQQIILNFGGEKTDIQLPYFSLRPVFKFNDEYYRVDEVLFEHKPFIVIEFGSFSDVINNTMEDADPFPYDLSDDELKNEISYSLGIKSYT